MNANRTSRTIALLGAALFLLLAALPLSAARLKDVAQVQDIRDNQLQGIGLISGLNGQGDQDLDLTNQAIWNMIREYGLNINLDDVESENMALVMVTSKIGAFAKPGDTIDVTVSSIGDAESLQGGVLLQTPLKAANGKVYAVAQGPVAVGGFIGGDQGQGGSSVQKNHPTTGIISSGAIVERPIRTELLKLSAVNFKLLNPDFTTSVRIADAVNRVYPGTAQAIDPGTVNILVPQGFRGQATNFIASLGNIEVTPDVAAKIVINERNGTIVATENVRISPVAISYGSLVIQVQREDAISQPAGVFNQGTSERTNNTTTTVDEQVGRFAPLGTPEGVGVDARTGEDSTVQELADALNKLGVTTRDMINILQTLKESGALHAELEIN